MGASATYGSSSSSSLSPSSGTGSVGAGLASSDLWRAPLLFNAANLLKYLEIWVDVSHSSLVKTFVPSAVSMDLIRAAMVSAVALFPVSSPWRKTSPKNWRTLVVKWTDFLVFFSAQPMSAVGGASSVWLWETETVCHSASAWSCFGTFRQPCTPLSSSLWRPHASR